MYINQSVARNRARTTEVIEHETAHRLLAATTTFGFTQYVVSMAEADGLPDARLRELGRPLWEAAWVPHEAAATYSSLALLPDEQRDDLEAELPADYARAYQMFANLLGGRAFEPRVRSDLARAIAARALQTSLPQDWGAYGLHDPSRLRRYLIYPPNNPTARLVAIALWLTNRPNDVLAAWAGRHVGDAERSLEPAIPSGPDGVPFFPLPVGEALDSLVYSLLGIIRPGDTHQRRSQIAGRIVGERSLFTVAVQPEPGPGWFWPNDEVDSAWCSEVDYVDVAANFNNFPVTESGNEPEGVPPIAPAHARLGFRRPDFETTYFIRTRIDRIPRVLAGNLTLDRATISIGPTGVEGVSPLRRPSTRAWARHLGRFRQFMEERRLVIHGVGDSSFVLYVAKLLAVEPGTPWEMCIVQSADDGPLTFALFRMRGDYKRLIVHVTVEDDWARTSDELVDKLPLGPDLDQASFFRAGPSVLTDFLRFRRGFMGDVLEDVPAWKAQLESMTKAILHS